MLCCLRACWTLCYMHGTGQPWLLHAATSCRSLILKCHVQIAHVNYVRLKMPADSDIITFAFAVESQSEAYSNCTTRVARSDPSFAVHRPAPCTSRQDSERASLVLQLQGMSLTGNSECRTTHDLAECTRAIRVTYGAAAVLAFTQA